MLVSANTQTLMTPLPKKPGEDPTAEAAAGLQGAMLQTLQNNVQAQTAQASAQVQASATKIATQQVSEASKISDNVDEAFAKTRVGLQASTEPLPTTIPTTPTEEFQEYMKKSPEERMRDAILEEMGLTQEEVDKMPPAEQQAVYKEIAERMQDKIKLAQAEKENSGSEKSSGQVDKLLASL